MKKALSQGRYTWRHDSVLSCLISSVRQKVPPQFKLYADLPGLRACDSPPATIPANISTSTARPDLVFISINSVTMIELTVPPNSREALSSAKDRKANKANYISLIGDLEERGLVVNYHTLEIGSLGHFLADTVS